MFRSRAFRAAALLFSSVTLLLVSAPGHAQNTDQCVAAFDQGQTLRDALALRKARERFALCSRSSCPAPLRADCAEALAALARDLPSIVPGARRADGSDIGNIKVYVDNAHVSVTPGAALDLDPGSHTLRYESPGYITTSSDVVLRVGERNRPVLLTMVPTSAAEPSSSDGDSRRSPWVWPLGALGVASLGAFAYFGINGLDDRSCAPRCAPHVESRVRTQFIAADVSLGIGVLALAGATYLFFASAKEEAR